MSSEPLFLGFGTPPAVELEAELAACYVFRLPFRLRLPNRHWSDLSWDGESFALAVHNMVKIPNEETKFQNVIKALGEVGTFRGWESLFTDVVVVVRVISEEEVLAEHVLAGNSEAIAAAEKLVDGRIDRAMTFVNQFVIAYSRVGRSGAGELWGGTPLSVLTSRSVLDSLSLKVSVVRPPAHVLTSNDVSKIFSRVRSFIVHSRPGQLTGSFHGAADQDIVSIPAQLDLQTRYSFYEMAFKARRHAIAGEQDQALLMAVIALESAVGSHVRHEMIHRALDHGVTPKKASGLADEYIRGLGISRLLETVPLILMPEDDRPSLEEIRACASALTARNAIVHSLVDKGGSPKRRSYAPATLEKHRKAVLKMYERYATAVAKSH